MDRTTWHIASKIKYFDNVILIPLPLYAPKLNLVEQLWLDIKQRQIVSNRCFKNYEQIVVEYRSAWSDSVSKWIY